MGGWISLFSLNTSLVVCLPTFTLLLVCVFVCACLSLLFLSLSLSFSTHQNYSKPTYAKFQISPKTSLPVFPRSLDALACWSRVHRELHKIRYCCINVFVGSSSCMLALVGRIPSRPSPHAHQRWLERMSRCQEREGPCRARSTRIQGLLPPFCMQTVYEPTLASRTAVWLYRFWSETLRYGKILLLPQRDAKSSKVFRVASVRGIAFCSAKLRWRIGVTIYFAFITVLELLQYVCMFTFRGC